MDAGSASRLGASASPMSSGGDHGLEQPEAGGVKAERQDAGESPPLRTRKRSLQAERLRSNMDEFASQLASIRAKVAARALEAQTNAVYDARLPVIDSRPNSGGPASPTRPIAGSDQLRLPLLRRIDYATQQNLPPRDPFVVVDSMERRQEQYEQFRGDLRELAVKEQASIAALRDANLLDEQVRVAAVAFSKHERNWPFDERARRYRELLELRKQAENARASADTERATAQHHRSQLRDPYRSMKVMASSPRSQLAPIGDEDFTWLWVLASPLPSLPFTPREETLQDAIEGEKELSTHVVYYIAPSSYSGKPTNSLNTSGQDAARFEDRPPSGGWICCSSHGAFPAPQITHMKSSIETWVVQGAGAGHVNGKYIICGVHDLVRKFRSYTGVELFRKRVPVMSALAQSLYDGPSAPETASTTDGLLGDIAAQGSIAGGHRPPNILPSALRSIEKDEHNFRSMQRVGAWIGMNEERERYRRMQNEAARVAVDPADHVSTGSESEPGVMMTRSPRMIKVQNDRDAVSSSSSNSIVHARPESCAPICKEWVLFLKCTKKEPSNDKSEVPLPPQKPGLGCPYRHYFISVEEKVGMTLWAQDREYLLERSVLKAIIAREAHIKSLKHLSSECMKAYQQNVRKDTDATLIKMLTELNHIRLVSVKVVEKIEAWRTHIRRLGFTRYDSAKESVQDVTTDPATDTNATSFLLGWSATITVSTGKQLYKGSKAFVSRIKRFCRPEDPTGKKEQHIVYLGYFKTRMEAERAYDEFATAEARRLNTTTTHLPRRRGVFRSCGKHFAVESERLGPSFCIECKTQALASTSSSTDDWTPPYYYTPGENYILRMAEDLDFLDEIPPLKSLLNSGRGKSDIDFFPLRGNAFLLPRDPIYDISVLPLTSFATVEPLDSTGQPEYEDVLDRERIAKVQEVLLKELHLHHPESIQEPDTAVTLISTKHPLFDRQSNGAPFFRTVEALYWDRCAALQMRQKRPPLAFRQPNVWCRPDAGEWASLVARGAHQLHFIFDANLAAAGREMQKKRKELLKVMRSALGTPLYFIHHRSVFNDLITAGQTLKGDVVQLEVNNLTKRLARYDAWCISSGVVQRCFRRYLGRRRAVTRLRALRQACRLRVAFMKEICTAARGLYEQEIVPIAVRRVVRKISTPVYRCVVKRDGEMLVVSVHALTHYRGLLVRDEQAQSGSSARKELSSRCCSSCARRFRVKAMYGCERQSFAVAQGVCTCKANGGGSREDEKWLLRAYNPVNNEIYRVEIGNAMLSQLLASRVHHCITNLRGESHRTFGVCNPIRDMQDSEQMTAVATILASYTKKRAIRAYQELLSWKRLNNDAMQARKTASVLLASCIETEDKNQADFNTSVVSAKKAMNFASRAFSEAQAWDPLENANDWRLLIEKRRLDKLSQESRQETERCRVTCFQATYNEHFTRELLSKAQNRYDSGWLSLVEQDLRSMEAAAIEATTRRAVVESLIRRLSKDFLSLRDKGVPLRRQLIVDKPMHLRATAIRLALPEMRRQRNCLRRRIIRLQNYEKGDRNIAKRMAVSVFVQCRTHDSDRSENKSACVWWATAYDPTSCTTQELFLEWEIVRLLVKWKSSASQQDDALLPRSARQQIADVLLSIAMLDRFTCEFTLRKLLFYQQMRLVRPQIYASKWFVDLQRGRKSGRGDEVLRQGASIGGRLGVVVVFENWGDLAFEFYHSASGRSYELIVPLHETSRRLCQKPLLFRLWVSSVISNSYAPAVLKHVLKLLVIEPSAEGERLRVRSDDSKSWKKCFQGARTIQGRRVLVSVREDASRDFRVLAFDLESNHSYVLEMEREVLAGIFKSGATRRGVGSQADLMPLLLRQNRRRLYEWVADHLQFQNLLEHPATLSTSLSPLADGFHVRQSFNMLNQWVCSRQRIPVMGVLRDEIDSLAAENETSAISSLLFDQLAIIPDAHLSFNANKHLLGSLEWADVCGRPLPKEAGNTVSFLKIDAYTQSHNLMIRLRRELFAETEQRRQKVAQTGMEREEEHSLAGVIHETLLSIQEATRRFIDDLESVRATADARVRQWTDIHAELARSARTGASQLAPPYPMSKYVPSLGETSRLEGIERLSKLVGANLLSNHLIFDILCSNVLYGAWVPLSVVSNVLGDCVGEMASQVTDKLRVLTSDFESTMVDSLSLRLQRLQHLRLSATNFGRDCLRCQEPLRPGDDPMSSARSGSFIDTSQKTQLGQQSSPTMVKPDELDVYTALLIPENPTDSLQEIFLDTKVMSCVSAETKLSHCERISTLTSVLEPIFHDQLASARRRSSSPPAEWSACYRVAGGLIFCQDFVSNGANERLQTNPRAVAATGHTDIRGIAVYIPFKQPSASGSDHPWHRIALGYSAYANLVKAVTPMVSDDSVLLAEGTLSVEMKRRIRSTKFLPWKQNASDRMRVARTFKRSMASFGRSVVDFSADDHEREDTTIATSCVSFRQLECATGRVLTALSSLEDLEGIRFVVTKAHSESHTGIVEWELGLASPLILSGLPLNSRNCDGDPTRLIGAGTGTLIDMDALQIEVDNVSHPRRLLFSCRDLQSRRRYVVDCGYYDLCLMLHAHPEDDRRRPTTIQAWRSLAELAAEHLTFRRKNGTQWLSFDVHERLECDTASPHAEDVSQVDKTSQSTSLFPPGCSVPIKVITNDQAKAIEGAIHQCCAQRFAVHQKTILHFVAREQTCSTRHLGLARRHEWVSMVLEDQRSHMLRGILVLDSKTLARVQAAHKNGTQRSRRQKAKTKANGGGNSSQLKEICKDLGMSIDSVDGVHSELEGIESDQKQRRRLQQQAGVDNDGGAGAEDVRDKEWSLSVVAEWWRRHLVRVAEEEAAKGDAQQQSIRL